MWTRTRTWQLFHAVSVKLSLIPAQKYCITHSYGTLSRASAAAAAAVLPEAEQSRQQATHEPTCVSHSRTIDRCMLLTAALRAVNNTRSCCKADYLNARFIADGPPRCDQCAGAAAAHVYKLSQTCTTVDCRLTERQQSRCCDDDFRNSSCQL